MIKNIHSGNVVCFWCDGMIKGECRMQCEDKYDNRKLWRFRPYKVPGYFNIVNFCNQLHLNCWANELGKGSVTIQSDSIIFRSHKAWTFIRVS